MIRRRLANRRQCETFEFETGGLKYVCSIGRFPDGRIGEVFLTNHRVNSQAGIMASDQAVLASLALQHGCPFETLRRALMRNSAGHATSPIGCAFDLLAIMDSQS
jgi:ribonucleoside-diphosphate reductase alpha chain